MKIIAVIPCFNEADHIKDVIQKTYKYVDEVVIADDNSTDDTVDVALDAGASLDINVTSKRGVGQNTKHGMEYALRQGADIIITLDGDGQHNPDEIPQMLQPLLENRADVVFGNRFTNYKTIPLYRRLGISIITAAYNCGALMRLGDAQCGYRAYKRQVLETISIQERGFAYVVETLVKIRKSQFKIAEVPVKCLYHKHHGDNSTIHPIRHGVETLLHLIYWRLRIEGSK